MSDIKRFLLKCAALILISTLIVFILNHFYVKTTGYANLRWQVDKLEKVPRNIDVANLGSSHSAWALNYDGIKNPRCFNFALDNQDLYYDYQMLKRYTPNLSKGCVVLISVSYFTFGFIAAEWPESAIDSRYYGILKYSVIKKHNAIDYFKQRVSPVLFGGNVRYLLRDVQPTSRNMVEPMPLMSTWREKDRVVNGEQRYALHIKMVKDVKNYPTNIAIVERIISQCRRNGFRPVLITPPYTTYYNRYFSAKDLERVYKTIDYLQGKFEIPYLDYSHDKRFGDDLSSFWGPDHMSLKAGMVFTRIVLNDLYNMGLVHVKVEPAG